MTRVEAMAIVSQDGTLTVQVPPEVSPGTHQVVVLIDEQSVDATATRSDFPVHDLGPWPADLPLRREDMYDEWGR
jgi:hypothetical protein